MKRDTTKIPLLKEINVPNVVVARQALVDQHHPQHVLILKVMVVAVLIIKNVLPMIAVATTVAAQKGSQQDVEIVIQMATVQHAVQPSTKAAMNVL